MGEVAAVAEAEAEEIEAWCAIGMEGARGWVHATDGEAAEGDLLGEGEAVDGAVDGADDDGAQGGLVVQDEHDFDFKAVGGGHGE